jgi:Domain of unknown function (DUF4926)
MTTPTVFDGVELLLDLPEENLKAGAIGTIIEDFGDAYEVEFSNSEGETLALCTLTSEQFIVIWDSTRKSWLPVAERVANLVSRLPDERGQQVLEFARSLCQSSSIL